MRMDTKVDKHEVFTLNKTITDDSLWETICKNKIIFEYHKSCIQYILNEFGTFQMCNRFTVGNSIEFIIADFLEELGYSVNVVSSTKRFHLCINGLYKLAIKFSSTGYITVHNSNSCINKDEEISDMLLITIGNIYLITKDALTNYNINYKEYTKNTGDSLKLKRSILKTLHEKNYPYIIQCDLEINRKTCKNRSVSEMFYKLMKKEYNRSLSITKN
jgi:hypothetical protein